MYSYARAIGERIRSLRSQRGISRLELAGLALVSQASLSSWETGRASPSAENILALAKVLEVPIEDLFPSQEESSLPLDPFGLESTKELMGLAWQMDPSDLSEVIAFARFRIQQSNQALQGEDWYD